MRICLIYANTIIWSQSSNLFNLIQFEICNSYVIYYNLKLCDVYYTSHRSSLICHRYGHARKREPVCHSSVIALNRAQLTRVADRAIWHRRRQARGTNEWKRAGQHHQVTWHWHIDTCRRGEPRLRYALPVERIRGRFFLRFMREKERKRESVRVFSRRCDSRDPREGRSFDS